MTDIRAVRLSTGCTLSGADIILDETNPENWLRLGLSEVMDRVEYLVDKRAADASVHRWTPYLRVVDALERHRSDATFYADQKPGLFDSDGTPLMPDAQFTVFDMLDLGVTGEDGISGFLKDCGLPEDITWETLLMAGSLMLVDQAVTELSGGSVFFAAYLSHCASSCIGEALMADGDQQAASNGPAERFQLFGSVGGKAGAAAHKAAKEAVAAAWDSGRYRTMEEAALALSPQVVELTRGKPRAITPTNAHATTLKWIREHKKKRLQEPSPSSGPAPTPLRKA